MSVDLSVVHVIGQNKKPISVSIFKTNENKNVKKVRKNNQNESKSPIAVVFKENPLNDYESLYRAGKDIWICRAKNSRNKFVILQRVDSSSSSSKHDLPKAIVDLKLAQAFSFLPRIISYYYFDGSYFIALDHNENRMDLSTFISDNIINEKLCFRLSVALIKMIVDLHERSFYFRDLCPANILIDHVTHDMMLFGNKKLIYTKEKFEPVKQFDHTFLPPGMEEKYWFNQGAVWQLGATIFEITTGKDFETETWEEDIKGIRDSKLVTIICSALDLKQKLTIEAFASVVKSIDTHNLWNKFSDTFDVNFYIPSIED